MQTPAPFEYERATSVEGAIASLRRLGSGARVIAGGHSLLPMMKLRLASPEHLIDINDLTDLAYIREEGGEIRIGALTRHVDLLDSELLAERYHRIERGHGGFSRTFQLPAAVDSTGVTADLRDGVLTVICPKVAEKTHRVNIS